MTPEYATCSKTKQPATIADGYFVADMQSGEWRFESNAAPEPGGFTYSVEVRQLVASPSELVDWLAHLSEKSWFASDKFFRAMHALRKNADQTTQPGRG
jgi:hypothetical protein